MSRSDVDYLRHILDEAHFLAMSSADHDIEDFLADETSKRAFVRSIEIMGEATKNLSEKLRSQHPDIEWKAMARMRDFLIHGYFGVDYEIVWDVATVEVPKLVERLPEIIAGLDAREP